MFLLIGAFSLTMVVCTHLCEGLHILAFMHWGEPHSAGHYLDLSNAALALALLPVGFVLRWRGSH